VTCHRSISAESASPWPAVEVDDHFDPRLVECRDQRRRLAARPLPAERRPEVVVRIDRRIARPADLVRGDAE
jgi:hypothetical protein